VLVNAGQGFKGAEQIARSIITLPTHSYVTDKDVSRMTGVIRGYQFTPSQTAVYASS
jgi:hypothetical protein